MKKLVFLFLLVGIVMSVNAQVIRSKKAKQNEYERAAIVVRVSMDVLQNETYEVCSVLPTLPSTLLADRSLSTVSSADLTYVIDGEEEVLKTYYFNILNGANNEVWSGMKAVSPSSVKRIGNCLYFYNVILTSKRHQELDRDLKPVKQMQGSMNDTYVVDISPIDTVAMHAIKSSTTVVVPSKEEEPMWKFWK